MIEPSEVRRLLQLLDAIESDAQHIDNRVAWIRNTAATRVRSGLALLREKLNDAHREAYEERCPTCRRKDGANEATKEAT